jgi:uncharacterized protein with GYD domain
LEFPAERTITLSGVNAEDPKLKYPPAKRLTVPKRRTGMLFIAMVIFRTQLSKETAEKNMKDIEADAKSGIKYHGTWWTPGKYDTIVMFGAPGEKAAMNMALIRTDRMDIEMMGAVPADPSNPFVPV